MLTNITVPGSGVIAVPKTKDVPLGPLTIKSPVGKKSVVLSMPFSWQFCPGIQTAFGGATLLQGVGPAARLTSNEVRSGPAKLPVVTLKKVSMAHVKVPEFGDGPNVTFNVPTLGVACKLKNRLLPSVLMNCIACI